MSLKFRSSQLMISYISQWPALLVNGLLYQLMVCYINQAIITIKILNLSKLFIFYISNKQQIQQSFVQQTPQIQNIFFKFMQKPQSSLQKSRTIGNYIITKNLGEGTFGKVKLGIHQSTGQKVAIKILQKNKIIDVADVQRVTRQIHILKLIRHPNLIQLYEIIQTPKQLFLVMEYVSQGELFQHIVKKKKLKENQACQFFRQLIAGVQYLHDLGVVHRDLKPQNLLIDFNKRLKIVDFGLSNTYKQKQLLKTACGSPCYAAPQMIAGKKYHGLAADIWSCGVILFAMICGYLPFEDPNTTLLYKKITSGDFSIPKYVSPQARQLLLGILTTDPQKRFKISDIKSHQWYKQSLLDVQIFSPYGIKIGFNNIPVDQSVLRDTLMQDSTLNYDETLKYILNNRHNHAITLYYLLLKRNLRNGVPSKYDICSSTFDPENLDKKVIIRNDKNPQDIEQIDLDRTTTATGPRSNRTISRINNFRTLNESPNITAHNFYINKRKNQSLQLKLDIDNLPIVDSIQQNSQRRRIHFQVPRKMQKNSLQVSLYDVQQKKQIPSYQRPIGTSFRPATFRTSINRSNRHSRRKLATNDDPKNQRYISLDVSDQPRRSIEIASRQKNEMNRTFMGRIPKAFNPKWQNQSERIRNILNTTITGHGKRKTHKIGAFF